MCAFDRMTGRASTRGRRTKSWTASSHGWRRTSLGSMTPWCSGELEELSEFADKGHSCNVDSTIARLEACFPGLRMPWCPGKFTLKTFTKKASAMWTASFRDCSRALPALRTPSNSDEVRPFEYVAMSYCENLKTKLCNVNSVIARLEACFPGLRDIVVFR